MTRRDEVDALFAAGADALSPQVLGHLLSGTDREVTLRRNRSAFDALTLAPRALRGVSEPRLRCVLFGRPMDIPVLLAPVGTLHEITPDGHRATLRAGHRAGVGVCSNILQGPDIGLDPTVSGGPARVLQIYAGADERYILNLAEHAADTGWDALVLTVDAPVRRPLARGTRPRQRSYSAANGQDLRTLTWDTVSAVTERSPIPTAVKGILTADDAERAVDAGCAAVYVSNHGGRALDGVVASLDALADIAAVVPDDVATIFDGGIRSATDIVVALALGADVVGIGRPYCLALAADGERGIAKLLSSWHQDLLDTLILLGARGVDELTSAHVRSVPPAPYSGTIAADTLSPSETSS